MISTELNVGPSREGFVCFFHTPPDLTSSPLESSILCPPPPQELASALRITTVDRKKQESVTTFIEHQGCRVKGFLTTCRHQSFNTAFTEVVWVEGLGPWNNIGTCLKPARWVLCLLTTWAHVSGVGVTLDITRTQMKSRSAVNSSSHFPH